MSVARWLLVLLAVRALCADLARVAAEPNPEKRSRAALENAEHALKEAREVYGKGDSKEVSQFLAEVKESVELAETSLRQTGKNPSRSPKHFKHAEIKTRDLLRRLESFQRDMNVADRPMLDPVRAAVQQVHDNMLLGVMRRK